MEIASPEEAENYGEQAGQSGPAWSFLERIRQCARMALTE
jgi:hypothetical protein